MKYIESKQNQLLKKARSLSQRKYRNEHGEFIVEGKRAVHDLIPTKLLLHIIIEERLFLTGEATHIIDLASVYDVPVHIIKESIPHQLALTETTQGIWAIGVRKEWSYAQLVETLKSESTQPVSLWIFLDRIQDPGNLGTIIRTALGAGAAGIIMTKGSVDLYNPKVVRSTMSAISKVPIYTNIDEEEAKALLTMPFVTSYALSPSAKASYEKVDYKGHVLLLLGNEGNGLDDCYLSIAHEQIKIPLLGEIESLNIAIAGAITMYKAIEKNF